MNAKRGATWWNWCLTTCLAVRGPWTQILPPFRPGMSQNLRFSISLPSSFITEDIHSLTPKKEEECLQSDPRLWEAIDHAFQAGVIFFSFFRFHRLDGGLRFPFLLCGLCSRAGVICLAEIDSRGVGNFWGDPFDASQLMKEVKAFPPVFLRQTSRLTWVLFPLWQAPKSLTFASLIIYDDKSATFSNLGSRALER